MSISKIARLEKVTNLLAVIGCLIFIGIFVNREIRATVSSGNGQATAFVGTKVNLPEFDFATNSKTIVLALSTTCGYCNASADSYRRLVPDPRTERLSVVAVFPQSVAEAEKYLSSKKDLSRCGPTGFA